MWLFLSLVSAVLAATINHFDKFLLSRYFSNGTIGVLLLFSGLIGGFASLSISLIQPSVLLLPLFPEATILVLSGLIYVSALYFYLRALHQDETSTVAPLFLTIPVFGGALGYSFLGEVLNPNQVFSGFLVLSGALVLVSEDNRLAFKMKVLIPMTLAAILMAINGLLFKLVALEAPFMAALFWEYLGFFLAALLFWTLIPRYRLEFTKALSTNKGAVLFLNGINELIAVAHISLYHLATLLAPIALVQLVVEGTQPLFIFSLGIIITLLFPRIAMESLNRRHIIKKMLALCLMILGTWLLW